MFFHGDDFVTVARVEGRAYVEQTLRSRYEIKVDFAGPEAHDPKQLKVLGRIITYEAHGITYEADPGRMDGVIHQLGFADAEDSELSAAETLERRKGYESPRLKIGAYDAVSTEVWDSDFGSPTGELLQVYQPLAARLNYYCLDRLDLLYPVKELIRVLSKPTEADMCRLKRAARYLLSQPRMVIEHRRAPLSNLLTIYTDADHAGCMCTHKSTSGT